LGGWVAGGSGGDGDPGWARDAVFAGWLRGAAAVLSFHYLISFGVPPLGVVLEVQ